MQNAGSRVHHELRGVQPAISFCILLLPITSCITFAGCAPATPATRLVVLSPHRDEIREEVARGFAEWYAVRHVDAPSVTVIWQDVGGGTSQIAKFVESQYGVSPDGIGVDLLFGGGTDLYLRFSAKAYLAPIELPKELFEHGRIPPDLNGVPLYDRQGRWYGAVLSSFGILSNLRVLERIGQPIPKRWEDLGQPGLCSWVGAGDPRMAGSVHLVYEIILQREGWDRGVSLILRLAANSHGFIRDSGTLTRQVTEGEVAAAGNIDANALGAVGHDPDGISYSLPAGATVLSPDSVAVLRGAPNAAIAREFIEYLLSDDGQRLFLLKPGISGGPHQYPLCRLSVVPALYKRYPAAERSVGDADPFTFGGAFDYKASLGERRWNALNDLLGAVAVDARAEIAAAWQTLLAASLPEDRQQLLEQELFRPPCSEETLADYARLVGSESPRYRAKIMNQWGEEARRRYRDVARKARSQ
jgi:ABC-type Fe3+ transport system substrate-binding protein